MIRRSPNATNALLQKVSSQLKGERIKKDEDEDDLNAYLKSLTQKTSQQRKSVNFEDVGEISISSEMDTSSSQLKKKAFVTSGNKFLKKKQTENSPGAKFLKKPQTSSASPVPTVSSQGRPDSAKSQGHPNAGKSQGQGRPQSVGAQSVGRSSGASALSKAAALSNKFAQRSAEMRNVFTLETDTSESFSTPRPQTPLGRPTSADSDSFKLGKDGNKFLKRKPEMRPTSPSKPRSPVSRSPKSTSPVPKRKDDKQKYLKKKESDTTEVNDTNTKAKASPYTLKSSLRHSTDVILSSGEESLAEFISGLDKKGKKHSQNQKKELSGRRSPSPSHHRRSLSPDSKPPAARRTPPQSPSPTPRRPQSPAFIRRSPSPQYRRSRSRSSGDSDFGDSLQSEVIEEVRDEESISSEDAFRVNVMDIDSLEPVLISTPASPRDKRKSSSKSKEASSPFKKEETKKKKKKKESKRRKSDNDDFFSNLGIHTVDDLLGDVPGVEEKAEIASLASEVSEIKTQSESEEIHTEKPSVLGQKKSQGISFHSILESEIRTQGSRSSSRKNSYTEDFEDSISERIGQASVKASKMRTLSEIQTRYSGDETVADDYTEDFGSDTESIATVSKTSQTSEKTITDSYRYDSYTESYTHGDRSPRADTSPTRHKKMKSVEVQTREPGLHYAWDSRYSGYAVPGPGFVDPTPIATHVVSPDALEAMTAYSPSMLALHDLLRQQLQLTRDFLQTQQYLYKSMADNIDTSYKYTTLEETKHYIKKHRKKRLTFKEALKLVDRECR